MVQALLDSTEYGSAHVEALLQARDGAAAPACDADGADGAGASVGRRLQEAEEAVDARSRAEGARAQGPAEEWATAAGARGSLGRRWDAWKRWMLDRPPPWERDCDCCYAHCPEHLNCLAPSGRSRHSPEPQPCAIARMHMAPPQRGAAAAHPSRLEQPASVGAPGGHASRAGSSPRHAALRHPPCPATQACCSRTSSTSHAAATRSGRCSRSSGPSGRARSWAARCSPCASGSSAPASPLPHPCLSRPRLAAPAQHRPSAIPGERPAQRAPRAALPRDCPPGLPRPRVLERRSAPPVQSPTPPPSTVQVLLVVAWLVVQARKLCGRRGEPPEERRSENADSDSD